MWLRDLAVLVTVCGAVWAAGQSIVRALDWIYVDLGKNSAAVQAVVTNQAEMRAIIDLHTKVLDKIDGKVDRLYIPSQPPQQPRSLQK